MGKNGFTNSDVRAFKGKANGGQNTYALGDGLRVRMRGDDGFYVFIYRPKFGPRRGKKVMLTLGPVSTIDIRDAQQWARDQATLLAKGDDPYEAKKARKQANDLATLRSKTFGQIVQEYYDKRTTPKAKDRWADNTKRHMSYVKNMLLAMPIAKLPVDKLVRGDFEKIINDYAKERSPTMALCLRDYNFGAMTMAGKQGCYSGDNPANPEKLDIDIDHTSKPHYGWRWSELPRLWSLLYDAEMDSTHNGLLTTAQTAKAAHVDRAKILALIARGLLPAKQANFGKTSTYLIDPADLLKLFSNANVANVESSFGQERMAAQILRLLLLTALRFSEVNKMEWNEIDLRRKVWTIPEGRTKAKRVHIVPLIDPALEILEERLAHRDNAVSYVFAHGHTLTGGDFLFGRPLSEGCVIKHLRRITADPRMTIHSFRRGCGSWADSQYLLQGGAVLSKYDRNFRRAVLGHAVSRGLDYVYGSEADFEEPCRILLTDWADYLLHGRSQPSESAEESKPSESAEVVELSTRRIAGA
jgi:integrase